MNLDELCDRLEMTPGHLRKLGNAPYIRKTIKKPGAAHRVVWSPCTGLREVHDRLLPLFHETLLVHNAATGFVKGRGPVYNARQHVGAKVLLQTDIVKFYDAITGRHVSDALQAAGYGATVSFLLASLCTRRQGAHRVLVQGAATSPVLANAVCYAMDEALTALAGDGTYTRYADDIAISWHEDWHGDADVLFLAPLYDAMQQVGFAPNKGKTKVSSCSALMRITGLLINPAPGRPLVRAPRHQWRRLRAGIHNWLKTGDETTRQEMRGLLSFLRQTDPERALPYGEVLK